jgi:hypothetical protein
VKSACTAAAASAAACLSLLVGGCPAPTTPDICGGCPADKVCHEPTRTCVAANPCAGSTCAEGFHCVAGGDFTPQCVPNPDPCATILCPPGKQCSKTTLQCEVIPNPCDGKVCQRDEACDPATGFCLKRPPLCENKCCPADKPLCDPSDGVCKADLCDTTPPVACECAPNEVCNSFTGHCEQVPGPCGAGCAENEVCDVTTRKCVVLPVGKPAPGHVGADCSATVDCPQSGAQPTCLTWSALFGIDIAGGYCTASCDVYGCPEGAGCFDLGLDLCLDLCRTDVDCRTGYQCSLIRSGDPRKACFPASSDVSTCSGPGCRPVGAACEYDGQCVAGANCANLPHGYCIKFGCSRTGSADNCPEPVAGEDHAICIGIDACSDDAACFATCDVTKPSCREGYACYRLFSNPANTKGYCYAGCTSDAWCGGTACAPLNCDRIFGYCEAPCEDNSGCAEGRSCDVETGRCYAPCATATADCGPVGVCDTDAGRCVPRCIDDRYCPTETFCAADGRCAPRCTTDASCGSTTLYCGLDGHCKPKCAADDQCPTTQYCGDDGHCKSKCTATTGCSFSQRCDTGSGRCVRDFTGVPVGKVCSGTAECGAYNGVCLGSDQGFPQGYCSATGCSVVEKCPEGSKCVETNVGSTVQQICAKNCDPAASGTCRAGYDCTTTTSGNVCLPD